MPDCQTLLKKVCLTYLLVCEIFVKKLRNCCLKFTDNVPSICHGLMNVYNFDSHYHSFYLKWYEGQQK